MVLAPSSALLPTGPAPRLVRFSFSFIAPTDVPQRAYFAKIRHKPRSLSKPGNTQVKLTSLRKIEAITKFKVIVAHPLSFIIHTKTQKCQNKRPIRFMKNIWLNFLVSSMVSRCKLGVFFFFLPLVLILKNKRQRDRRNKLDQEQIPRKKCRRLDKTCNQSCPKLRKAKPL